MSYKILSNTTVLVAIFSTLNGCSTNHTKLDENYVTLQDYARYLLDTYGPDARVTIGFIAGVKNKNGFIDQFPNTSRKANLHINWSGPWREQPCQTYLPPTSSDGFFEYRWCKVRHYEGPVLYQGKQDVIGYGGAGRPSGYQVSYYYRCQDLGDQAIMRLQRVYRLICRS